MPRRIYLVEHYWSPNEKLAPVKKEKDAVELEYTAGQSLYDILVQKLPVGQWSDVLAVWEVRETERAADGSTQTKDVPAVRYIYNREHKLKGSIRGKIDEFQREIENIVSDCIIHITDVLWR